MEDYTYADNFTATTEAVSRVRVTFSRPLVNVPRSWREALGPVVRTEARDQGNAAAWDLGLACTLADFEAICRRNLRYAFDGCADEDEGTCILSATFEGTECWKW